MAKRTAKILSNKWFKNDPGADIHTQLFPLVQKIQENQIYRQSELLMWARLYGNIDMVGLSPNTYSRANTPVGNQSRPKFNLIASCIDTLAAKISKNRPRGYFLTDGGDWNAQARAKKLQKFMDGQFYSCKTYEETDKAFIDCGVSGTGNVKVFTEDGKLKHERTMPGELVVDDAEAMYAKPVNLYQCKPVDRDYLADLFPDSKAEIMDLPTIDDDWGFYNQTDSDMVLALEAWHLDLAGRGKGRKAIVTQNATLNFGDWKRKTFPFATMRYKNRQAGWYGQGIAEVLVGTQVAINRILRNNDVSQYLHQAPAWLVEESSAVVSAHLNNDIGHIVKYKGIPPALQTFAAAHPEMYTQIQTHIQRGYEEVGISQLSAASAKPAGLDSGKALREYNDIETERFIKLGQQWEQFHLDIVDLSIDEMKENGVKTTVLAKSGSFTETLKWSEVDMPRDKYILQTFPTSQLPRSPSAKMQYIIEMRDAGMIDPETAQELLDMPDLQTYANLKFAGRQVIRQAIEKMMDDETYVPPEPFQDLTYSLNYAQMFYNFAKLHGAEETKLEMLRRYMQQVNGLMSAAVPPAPPEQAGPVALAPQVNQEVQPLVPGVI